jgi:hypothetical protein
LHTLTVRLYENEMKEVATARKLKESTIGSASGEEASRAASGLEPLLPLLPITHASHRRNIERDIAMPPKMEALICERVGIVITCSEDGLAIVDSFAAHYFGGFATTPFLDHSSTSVQ